MCRCRLQRNLRVRFVEEFTSVLERILETANMPTCEYTIRRGSPNGPQIRFAKVGDIVYHRWECTSDIPQMFGILINNCYVDDGAGQRVQVLDSNGFDCVCCGARYDYTI